MIDRRTLVTAALAAIAGPAVTRTARAQAGMSRITAYAFSFPALAGGDIRLADHTGRPLLIVNTASLCGYTPQYAGLQELWREFHDRGLMIIGVPSNDFADHRHICVRIDRAVESRGEDQYVASRFERALIGLGLLASFIVAIRHLVAREERCRQRFLVIATLSASAPHSHHSSATTTACDDAA